MSYESSIRRFMFKSKFSLAQLNTKLKDIRKRLESNNSFDYSIDKTKRKGWYTLDSDDFAFRCNYDIDKLFKFLYQVIFPGTSVDIISVGEDGETTGVRITSKSVSKLEFGVVRKRIIYPKESDIWDIPGKCCDDCGTEINGNKEHFGLSGVYCEDCWGAEHIIKKERREREE